MLSLLLGVQRNRRIGAGNICKGDATQIIANQLYRSNLPYPPPPRGIANHRGRDDPWPHAETQRRREPMFLCVSASLRDIQLFRKKTEGNRCNPDLPPFPPFPPRDPTRRSLPRRSAYDHRDVRWLNLRLQRRISVLGQRSARDREPEAEPLHEAEDAHGFREVGVSVVGHPGLAEILRRHGPERPARAGDLD